MIPWDTDEGKHSSAEPLSFKFLLRKRFYRNIGGDERRKITIGWFSKLIETGGCLLSSFCKECYL